MTHIEFETNHGTRYAFRNNETDKLQCIGSYMSAETLKELRRLVETEYSAPSTRYSEGAPGYSEACGIWD